MKRYIRTKDDKIFDLENIKKLIVEDSCKYYTNFKGWKLKKEFGELHLCYKATGTEANDLEGQANKENEFAVVLNCESNEYVESDNLIDLIDGFLIEEKGNEGNWFITTLEIQDLKNMPKDELIYTLRSWSYYGFLKTKVGLIYKCIINKKGEPELL